MSEYPVVLTYTTYHCVVCRAIVSAICKSHPTAKVVSVENYTDGRPPSNPWNLPKHVVKNIVDYAVKRSEEFVNGNTVQRTTEVVEKSSKAQKPDTPIGGTGRGEVEIKAKGKRGRPKGAKKCSKCQRFHIGTCN